MEKNNLHEQSDLSIFHKIKYSSGKIKYIFRRIILKLVQNFKPCLIIVNFNINFSP